MVDDSYIWEGSPPRVRGKVLGGRRTVFEGRITPACAGKRLYYEVFAN